MGEQESGRVFQLRLEELGGHGALTLSSHGISVGTVVPLAKRFNAEIANEISIVGVAIEPRTGVLSSAGGGRCRDTEGRRSGL